MPFPIDPVRSLPVMTGPPRHEIGPRGEDFAGKSVASPTSWRGYADVLVGAFSMMWGRWMERLVSLGALPEPTSSQRTVTVGRFPLVGEGGDRGFGRAAGDVT